MRAGRPSIAAPPFPRDLPWINVAGLRMDQQRGKAVLVEFWDFCRVNSLRDSMCYYLLQRKATPKQHDYFATWQAIHKAGPSFGQEEGHQP